MPLQLEMGWKVELSRKYGQVIQSYKGHMNSYLNTGVPMKV